MTTKTKIELVALFKSLGESVTFETVPNRDFDGSIEDFGEFKICGDMQTISTEYGNLAELEEEFVRLEVAADELLPKLATQPENERIDRINFLFSLD